MICGDKASLTMSRFVSDGPVELIGHLDKYYACCIDCADDDRDPEEIQ
jgi:hypothetical protein